MRIAVAIFYWVAAFFLILLTWRAEVAAERKSSRNVGKAPLGHKGK